MLKKRKIYSRPTHFFRILVKFFLYSYNIIWLVTIHYFGYHSYSVGMTGGNSRAQWEDVTGSTPLTFVKDCVSFTTTVSARFWLMDCRHVSNASNMASELYREISHVPFMAKLVLNVCSVFELQFSASRFLKFKLIDFKCYSSDVGVYRPVNLSTSPFCLGWTSTFKIKDSSSLLIKWPAHLTLIILFFYFTFYSRLKHFELYFIFRYFYYKSLCLLFKDRTFTNSLYLSKTAVQTGL